MSMPSSESKLHADPRDIPVAEALPLRDTRSGGPAKAYTIGYKNYHDGDDDNDAESGLLGGLGGKKTTTGTAVVGEFVGEATVLENMGWDPETRRAFIRRVYAILSAQLSLTGFASAFMALHVPTRTYVLTHDWPVSVSIFLSILLIISLMCLKDREPHNMYLLCAFTIVEAFLVGSVTTAYCASGQRGVVLEAVFLTGIIFVGLTVYTYKSKVDFSFLGAALYMGLGALVVWGLLAMVLGVRTGYVYALLGCIVFSGYVLFDTWLIMDKLSPHEHVLAAIMLYLDIINLFLYLLQLLTRSDER
ncbi:hypothetical protein ACHAXA_002490 [Cyclostephanos tholiformis]|uniref:Uncharacterized protein n=1 Tax=Cyclostephanos tholiformis TaxID=382380 RepID=A0ABD3RZU0_9STRA